MSAVIFKFPLTMPDDADLCIMEMSAGPIIHAGTDPMGQPCLWALTDVDKPYVERTFLLRGTGMVVPDDAVHLLSWVNGAFVWHLFEIGVEP